MKLHEIATDNDDDEFLTPLKDLSAHNCHGRVWVSDREADDALDAAFASKDSAGGRGDALILHDWMSDHVYEISISAVDMNAVVRILKSVKAAVPRAHLFTCTKRGMINHSDWRDYP